MHSNKCSSLVVNMQTMKFRKSRIVIMVVFLISVSSVGYWFMYTSSSHRRSDLSRLHGHSSNIDTEKNVAPRRHSRRKGSADEDGDYVGLFRNKDRNRIEDAARIGAIGQQGDDIGSVRQERPAAGYARGRTGSKQVNAGRQPAELKKNGKYDERDEDAAVAGVKAADGGAGGEEHQKDSQGDREVNEYKGDYEDDAEHPVEIEIPHSSKNSKQVSNVGRDHETANQLQSEGKQRKEDVESVADGDVKFDSRKQLRDAGMVDERYASVVEPKFKQKDDDSQQVLKWRQDSKQTQVNFHRFMH